MDKIIYRIKKNKIAVFMIFLSLAIFFLTYSNFKSLNKISSIKENKLITPHVLVIRGSAIIKRDNIIRLKEKEQSDLKIGDKIRTFDDSNATIFWPDGSVTRLSEKTGIEIKDMRASKDLSKINIRFDLEEGKTWSNITKFLDKDSHFTETYDDGNYAATVRGTVFEMNLDGGYVHAVDHDVILTDNSNDKTSNIPEGSAKSMFNVMNSVPSEVWDTDWIEDNLKKDSEYLKEMAEQWKEKLEKAMAGRNIGTNAAGYLKSFFSKDDYVISNIGKSLLVGDMQGLEEVKDMISGLSPDEKSRLNRSLVGLYQNIHDLPNDEMTASNKYQLRDMILDTSDEEDKKRLLKDFARLGIYDYLDITKDRTSEASSILKKNIEGYLKQMSDPEEVKDLLSSFGTDMLGVIGIDFAQISKEAQEIKDKLNDTGFQRNLKDKIIRDATDLNDSIDNILDK